MIFEQGPDDMTAHFNFRIFKSIKITSLDTISQANPKLGSPVELCEENNLQELTILISYKFDAK